MTAGGPETHIVDGRFELRERLGGGGMGLVWRAYDLALRREVALKEVRADGSDLVPIDPNEARMQRERVLREAQALARLQHPNVVTIYHIVDSPQMRHPWLVMELVAGGSLDDRLERGPLSPAETARLGRGVLAALAAAHAAGIQHRDVKPANVLLRPDGTPVLTDFGIAALQDQTSLTATGTVIGSPEYMAPERIRGQEGDSASDLWSLGMLLYTAVEGHNPMSRATTMATLAAVLDGSIPPPQRAGALTPVLGALLQRDPAARPPETALDRMLADAQWAADGTQLTAMPQAPAGGPFGGVPYAPSMPSTPNMAASGFGTPSGGFTDALPSGTRAYGSGAFGAPSGHSATAVTDFIPPPPTAPAKKRRPILIAAASAVAVVVVAAAVLIATQLGSHSSDNHRAGTGYAAPTTSPRNPGASTSPHVSISVSPPNTSGITGGVSGDPTLAWINTCISKLEGAMHTTKVVQLVIYSNLASAEAPLASNANEYNDYDFVNGSVNTTPDPAGDASGGGTVDIGSVQWSMVPGLFAQADSVLKVPSPTEYYVILDKDFDGNPELLIYEANDYGGGYIHADVNGNVIETFPFGS